MPRFILDDKPVLACALAGPVPEEYHCVEVLTVAFCRVHLSAPVDKRILAAGDHDTSGVVSMDARRLGSCLFCVLWLDEACMGIFKLLLSSSGDILVTTP